MDHSCIFSKSETDIGCSKKLKHQIVIEERFPIAELVKRIPVELEEKVDKMVEDLLAKEVIRESESLWIAPLVCITKANGDIRLCVDYRQLNAVTLRPIYPIPEAAQLFDSLEGAKVFCVLESHKNADYMSRPQCEQCEIKHEDPKKETKR